MNRHDQVEKAVQIRNMYAIYQKAEQVIAWLGHADASTQPAFALMEECFASRRASWPEHGAECRANLRLCLESLRNMLQRSWFRRTWIRQEVFASRKVLLQCGSHQTRLYFDWDLRAYLMGHVSSMSLLDPSATLAMDEAWERLEALRRGPIEGYGTAHTLLKTLQTTPNFETSNDRDRVYGLLGMIANLRYAPYGSAQHANWLDRLGSTMQQFPIDYTKSVREVFQDVTHFAAWSDGNLRVLGCFELQPDRAPDLPSWAIDWRRKVYPTVLDALDKGPVQAFSPYRSAAEALLSPDDEEEAPSRQDLRDALQSQRTSGSAILHPRGILIGRLSEKPLFKRSLRFVLNLLGIPHPFETSAGRGPLRPLGYRYGCSILRYNDLFKTSFRNLNLLDKDKHYPLINDLKGDSPLLQNIQPDMRPLYNLAVVPKSAQVAESDMVVCLQSHTVPFLLPPLGNDRYFLRGIVPMHTGLHTAISDNWSRFPQQEYNLV